MSSPLIWSGANAKLLKSNLDFNGQAQILSGTVDPTSSATSAPIGSLYLNSSSGKLFRKTDAGSTTNWKELSNLGTVVEATLGLSSWGGGTGYADLVSISLTAGTWAISWTSWSDNNGTVTATSQTVGVGTVAGNDGTGVSVPTNGQVLTPLSTTTGLERTMSMSNYIVTPVSTTTYYLKNQFATSGANLRVKARMTAIRIA